MPYPECPERDHLIDNPSTNQIRPRTTSAHQPHPPTNHIRPRTTSVQQAHPTHNNYVISTGAADSTIVRRAVERPPYFAVSFALFALSLLLVLSLRLSLPFLLSVVLAVAAVVAVRPVLARGFSPTAGLGKKKGLQPRAVAVVVSAVILSARPL
jgi:hypothetical protein